MTSSKLCVALTGGTGFVGRHILDKLTAAGHRVRALARDPQRLPSKAGLEPVAGDLFDEKALAALVQGADAVVHIVGIIMEKPGQGQTFDRVHRQATESLLAAAKAAGVKRWVHMSALGARPDAVADYHRSKWAAEEAVRHSGMEWTIFRPSIIHGPDGEFMTMVKGFWCSGCPPFVPYFSKKAGLRDMIEAGLAGPGPGKPNKRASSDNPSGLTPQASWAYVSAAPAGRLQPIWIDDVAECFVKALELRRTVGETYPLGGPDAFTWPELYLTCKRYITEARNKKVVAIPVWYANLLTKLIPRLPFNRDQVIMSQEDSICQIGKVEQDLEIKLAGFEATFAEYAGRIGQP